MDLSNLNADSALTAAAAFAGGYLAQLRTRKNLTRAVREAMRPRARRWWLAVADLSRRVAHLERLAAPREP